ncbi:uncharacterized protein Eint_051220 [Encephalitozoon intestinalis ATCC 50506]|uniref:Pyrimidine 5-nucleotidase n=1 Tax=Encephalitozoon intestinalis (strain ATCC 50506) TaxID=876142 RepID=E0S6Y3_ENCIT|nr:uncharacterized protein Eint_051220 [Encephalitozoon intestinalis ATCC 50506]ADM11569.1 hypothetical protein Eint_051220 [Encephalitozoon intestinalis ATCC 50506]UTX45285.1 HAD hydrolase [Encephalitozoon intestinalis]
MRGIGNVVKAIFKVFSSGIKKAESKAKRLMSSSCDKGKIPTKLAKKSEKMSFPMEEEKQHLEDSLPSSKDFRDEKPFQSPVFIEMGQDLSLLDIKLKKIGSDTLFLYDIDDTLYHPSNNLQEMEKKFLMEKYISLKEGGTEEMFEEHLAISLLYSFLFYKYVGISLEEYWKMLSEFDYLQYLSPDPSLREFLLSMKNVRRCCFTNGPRDRAENILAKIGILDCFEVVICIGKYDTTFCCKPHYKSYEFVTKALGIEVPRNVYFFDDSNSNVVKAKEIGWNGELITKDCNIINVSSRILQAIDGPSDFQQTISKVLRETV